MPTLRGFLVVALVGAFLSTGLSTVAASHWTLYHTERLDPSAGRTLEDDGMTFDLAGNPFEGRANRVVAPGRIPGDGSLFLDTRMANRVGTAGGGLDVFPGMFAESVTERPDLLLPGYHALGVWYGWWRDVDSNAFINDLHDTACQGAMCPEDEFAWRGIASEESLAMVAVLAPKLNGGTLLAAHGNASDFIFTELTDNTDVRNPQQEWAGGFSNFELDAPLLSTLYTLTSAGARSAPGSHLGYDLDDPNGLIDVDRYSAVSSDLEALWTSSVRFALGDDPTDIDRAIGPHYYGERSEMVNESLALAFNITLGAVFNDVTLFLLETGIGAFEEGMARATEPAVTLIPRSAREPNTEWDDYGGRALYGGVGDFAGSRNAYPGYQDGYHLFVDTQANTRACAGVRSVVAGPTSASGASFCQTSGDFDLSGSLRDPPQRTSGTFLGFNAYIAIWRDDNRDSYTGTKCDPESEEFDRERNVCSNATIDENPMYAGWPDNELVGVCDVSSARGGTLTVTPVNGNWPGVVVMRDSSHTPSAATGGWKVHNDASPIVLDWGTSCRSEFYGPFAISTRDVLFFPEGGSDVAIRVESQVSFPGYLDVTNGIEVGHESVTDVDVLPAAM